MRYDFTIGAVPAHMHAVEADGLGIGPGHPPRIMGVLNVSEESPYDPSVFTEPSEAAEYVDNELIDPGGDVVDIGLASANKRFDVLSANEELERLHVALDTIASVSGSAVFSIETRYAEVARSALDGGFDMVNDISGFADPQMPDLAVDYDVPVVKMAGPGDLERPGALTTVDDIYEALASDPLPDQTIIDPAFGGWHPDKDESVDRETFRRLREFQSINRPMLVSINRKNFLRNLVGRSTEEALPVSLAATSMAVERGADIIRTHDVAATHDAALIGHAFADTSFRGADLEIEELDISTSEDLRSHLHRIGASEGPTIETDGRSFELRNLDHVDVTLLEGATSKVGGTFIAGSNGRHLLLGTTRELRDLASRLDDRSAHLPASLERILDAIS